MSIYYKILPIDMNGEVNQEPTLSEKICIRILIFVKFELVRFADFLICKKKRTSAKTKH